MKWTDLPSYAHWRYIFSQFRPILDLLLDEQGVLTILRIWNPIQAVFSDTVSCIDVIRFDKVHLY